MAGVARSPSSTRAFTPAIPLALARCYQGVVRLEQGRLVEAEALLKSAVELAIVLTASPGPTAPSSPRRWVTRLRRGRINSLARTNGVTGATLDVISAALSKTKPK